MSILGNVLQEMLMPDKANYWDSVSFEAGLSKTDMCLILYLNTYTHVAFNNGYLKSHSRMNISKLRKAVKEVLNLDKPKIDIGNVTTDGYYNQIYRSAILTYKIDQDFLNILEGLISIKKMHK